MTDADKIKSQLVGKGFVELPITKTPKSLLWQPNFLLTKDGCTYLVLVKSNNSVLPAFLNRVATIPKGNIVPLIVFCQKPSATVEKFILAMGIGLCYFLKGKLSNLIVKKKLTEKVAPKKTKVKPPVIDIFVSSKQNIAERKFVEDRIENLRKINSYPFNPPHLIEYDKFKPSTLYKHIDEKMKICEWVVIILEDNPSDYVKYEIKKAIKEFNHDNIFIFAKLTKTCREVWEKELTKINNLATQSIKYLPYSNLSELEVYLSIAIKERLEVINKRFV